MGALTKLHLAPGPETGPHAQSYKLDEVTDICVKLVRSIQLLKRTKGQVAARKCLKYEAQLKRHFPSLSRPEAVRLANIVVHASSLAFRHAMGISIVPWEGPRVRFREGARGALLDAEGTKLDWETSLELVVKDARLKEVSARQVHDLLVARGWRIQTTPKPLDLLRDRLDNHPRFRRKDIIGRARVVYRFLGPSSSSSKKST